MLCLSKLLRQEFIAWMMDGAERASTASRGAGSLPVLSVQGTGKKIKEQNQRWTGAHGFRPKTFIKRPKFRHRVCPSESNNPVSHILLNNLS